MADKKTFQEYIQEISAGHDIRYSEELMIMFEQAYDLHVGLAPFFSSDYYSPMDEEEIVKKLNNLTMKLYRIQLHNVGSNPYKRYFKQDTHFDWLKVEHYLISHMYAIKKSESFISNKAMAINIGWLSSDEKNPDIIARASRKVTEALRILKEDRKTFDVDHLHKATKNGSYHKITANWLVIIPLYQAYDPDNAFTIRERKGIRFRILSLLYKSAKSYSQGLRRLMKLQKDKYLSALITMDLETFRESRFWWQFILDHYKRKWRSSSPISPYGPKYLVPEYNHPEMTLYVKDEALYKEVMTVSENIFSDVLKTDFNITLSIVPQF